MPAVWDELYAWGVLNEQAPDPDMPRGTVDPSHGNTLYAMLADIRTAWRRAFLPEQERFAIELMCRFQCTSREAGKLAGVSHVAMQTRYDSGIGRLMRWLNGTEAEVDEEQAEAA